MADGAQSHSEGYQTNAIGDYSHSEGYKTAANATSAHAEGCETEANGAYSHAEGNDSRALGAYSHAEGQETVANNTNSHAEGLKTTAYAVNSHAEGSNTLANADGAHAEGKGSSAQGDFSHAEGNYTTATGRASHAEGDFTFASENGAHAEGSFYGYMPGEDVTVESAVLDPTQTFITITLKQAYTLPLEEDFEIRFDKTISNEEWNMDLEGDYITNSIFRITQVTYEENTDKVKSFVIEKKSYQQNFPLISEIIDSKFYLFRRTQAIGVGTHAEGCGSRAEDHVAHAEGLFTSAKRVSHAEGYGSYATGEYSHAEGTKTAAVGPSSHTQGVSTKAEGRASSAAGLGTTSITRSQHVFGEYNVIDQSTSGKWKRGNFAEIVGNGTKDTPSNARTLTWDGIEWLAGGLVIGPRNRTTNPDNKDGSEKLMFQTNETTYGNGTTVISKNTWSIWAAESSTLAQGVKGSSGLYFGCKDAKATYSSYDVWIGLNNRVYANGFSSNSGNDYAEYRKCNEEIAAGRVVAENGDGTLSLTTKRLQKGCEIVSDTFGSSLRPNEEYNLPIATVGRVLAYPDKDVSTFEIGSCVCSGENGTISQMTEEEERLYPGRILGTVSEIPTYEVWKNGNEEIQVNGRIWIRVR